MCAGVDLGERVGGELKGVEGGETEVSICLWQKKCVKSIPRVRLRGMATPSLGLSANGDSVYRFLYHRFFFRDDYI